MNLERMDNIVKARNASKTTTIFEGVAHVSQVTPTVVWKT